MQDVSVSHGKRTIDKKVRREELPWGHRFKVVVYRVSRSWYDANVDGKKK
jgi:hypothetical protein